MDEHAAKLARWLKAAGARVEHRSFEVSTHSVAEAARAVGAAEAEFVKSICMLTADDHLVVAIVRGEDRASRSRVGELLSTSARLASPEEMLARSGYPAGGTPPFGFEALFLIDERVMEMPFVWAGGGSDRALVRVEPAEMARLSGARVVRVRR